VKFDNFGIAFLKAQDHKINQNLSLISWILPLQSSSFMLHMKNKNSYEMINYETELKESYWQTKYHCNIKYLKMSAGLEFSQAFSLSITFPHFSLSYSFFFSFL
jgi:hypothetical protein